MTKVKKLYRSRKNRKVAGVCAGVAEFYNIDPTVVRLIGIALILFTSGVGLIFYLAAWLIIPEHK